MENQYLRKCYRDKEIYEVVQCMSSETENE